MGAMAVSGIIAATFVGSAQAADTNTANAAKIPAVGSDTIDEVVGALSALPGLDIANYNATGSATVSTTANYPSPKNAASACGSYSRQNGSGNGKNALSAAMRGISYGGSTNFLECVGIARSSSSGFPADANGVVTVPSGTMARIPLALDAVAPAVKNSSSISKQFTYDFLKSVYTRNGVAGSADCLGVAPLVPQAGSGTRGFWATSMGVTDYDFSGTAGAVAQPPAGKQTWGSCVTGGAANPLGFGAGLAGGGQPGDRAGTPTGPAIQEHDGTALSAANMVVPISIAQNIVMGSQLIADKRGSSQLASVDFTKIGTETDIVSLFPDANDQNLRHPYAMNGGSGVTGFSGARGNLTRTVYLFVPRALYDSTFTANAAAPGFGSIPAADKDKFKAEFANLGASTMCQASSTITLYGFSPVSDCGTPTLNP